MADRVKFYRIFFVENNMFYLQKGNNVSIVAIVLCDQKKLIDYHSSVGSPRLNIAAVKETR
jgi:hypothetical protein